MPSLPTITLLLRGWKHSIQFVALLAVFSPFCGATIRAQDAASRLCSVEFFSAQRSQWAKKDYEFHLLKNGSITQGGNTYVLAVAFEGESKARASEDVQFLVFQSPAGKEKFTSVYTEKIDVGSFGNFSVAEDGCITAGAGIYFRVSVVDLAGSGNQQVVVESNSVGTCSSCLSYVRIYQIRDDKITKVVEETYNDIKFARGQGLWIQSFRTGSEGKPIAYEKTFFAKSDSGKTPNH